MKYEVNGTRLFTFISKVKDKKKGTPVAKKNWRIMAEEFTQTALSGFYDKKSDMVETTCEQIKRWKYAGLPVKYIPCGNAGDNFKLDKRFNSADW